MRTTFGMRTKISFTRKDVPFRRKRWRTTRTDRFLRERKVDARALVSYESFLSEVSKSWILESPGLYVGTLCNSFVFLIGRNVLLKGLTKQGVLHAWWLGTLVYSAFGIRGYFIVCLYFLLGSAVTKLKIEQKQKEGIAEERSGRRSPSSVWGSGAAAILCSTIAIACPTSNPWMRLGYVTSIASKLADTASSEVGKAYGKTTYLSTTFEKVPRGTDGAISLEGTLGGLLAALIIGGLAYVLGMLGPQDVFLCGACAMFANWFESLVGATYQKEKEWLTNDLVNVMQIVLAAVASVGCKFILSRIVMNPT